LESGGYVVCVLDEHGGEIGRVPVVAAIENRSNWEHRISERVH
jgi:hypothetical protein